ncbi:cysteine-rich receptor-like protein kinase 10 [Dendrobium catenatum]|uniref:cysteine-rich receptor-like protein kinase 10 n=1 Tax=Dendrobium catenatum TaxID=906689 RepID=UPI00109F15B8|nr:cysteine-rich receptor-like protein kinase 10 [Dendrobium catenatum]
MTASSGRRCDAASPNRGQRRRAADATAVAPQRLAGSDISGSTGSKKSMALLLLVLLSLFSYPATSDLLNHKCNTGVGNFINKSTYSTNLNHLISSLYYTVTTTGFATSIIGSGPDRVCGLAICRGDIGTASCRYCISTAITNIQQFCPNNKDATIWYDHCLFRYSSLNFLYVPDVTMNNQFLMYNTMTVSADQMLHFEILTTAMIDNITDLAVRNTSRLVATGEMRLPTADIIYGMVQCTRDLSADECRTCLQGMVGEITKGPLKGMRGGRVMGFWCFMRYEFYKFYDGISMLQLSSSNQTPRPLWPSSPRNNWSTPNATHPPADLSHRGKSMIGHIMTITLPIAVALVLITTAGMCFWTRKAKMKIYREGNVEEITSVESLFFDLPTLEVATTNFSEHNKIGEGGFGSVYRGLLPDGREIAVKRLSVRSRQGLSELKNEFILAAKLRHKNLVRLHGVCLEGQEKLLVYEYLPNKSLDTILFDPRKSELLDWLKRYKIIEGIARGLLYLQEDSNLKIIHRDIKASNILLDEDMNPKISDFGMARLFKGDATHEITSRIAGTYGYMAPEYAIHGHFSIKSDVFSFGVLILEMITGRSSNGFFDDELSENLLSYVWENWSKETIFEIVDQALGKLYQNSELIRCINIGLLCVQEDPARRPTMIEVLVMLNSYSMTLKAPSLPAFLDKGSGIQTGTLSRKFNVYEDDTYRSSSKSMPMSPNGVSISELDPR